MYTAIAAVILALCITLARAAEPPVIPDLALTPGVTNPAVTQDNIHSTICVPGWSKSMRPTTLYTNHLKRTQLAVRGFAYTDPRLFEEDHLISIELGGHPTDEKNLWPEPWAGPWGARIKDRLENHLHRDVCAGRTSLAAAQAAIRGDWRRMYCAYYPGPPCSP